MSSYSTDVPMIILIIAGGFMFFINEIFAGLKLKKG